MLLIWLKVDIIFIEMGHEIGGGLTRMRIITGGGLWHHMVMLNFQVLLPQSEHNFSIVVLMFYCFIQACTNFM
jgi:hypothetical protein